MKKSIITLALLTIISCATGTKSVKTIDPTLMENVLNSKTYDIPITAIINNDGTKSPIVTNTSMSNGDVLKTTGENKMLEGEYYLRVRPNVIAVNLPFSGKSRNAGLSYASTEPYEKNISFEDVNYTVNTKKNGDKVINIQLTKKIDDLKYINIDIDKNGTASIQASKINGQQISYVGYIYN